MPGTARKRGLTELVRAIAGAAIFALMKQALLSFTVAGMLLAPSTIRAEAPRIEHVVDLLQQAKASDKPLPLLEQAHKALKEFNPANGMKATAAGIGAKRQANNSIAAHEHKQRAMKAIGEAIELAKQGGNAKPKIDSAIALTHQAGDLKR